MRVIGSRRFRTGNVQKVELRFFQSRRAHLVECCYATPKVTAFEALSVASLRESTSKNCNAEGLQRSVCKQATSCALSSIFVIYLLMVTSNGWVVRYR